MQEAAEDRHEDDLDIQPQGPVFDVIKIMLDAGMQAGVSTPAMYLRPAGKTGFDQVFFHVMRHFFLVLFYKHRAFWPGPDQ